MNILDLPGLDAIRPEDAQQYLKHSGWKKADAPPVPGSIVFTRAAPKGGKVTVQLVIVEVLAALEQRSPLDVLVDLLLPSSDAIHCRV
jgi:hypothetical protein